MDDDGQSVDLLTIEQDIDLDHIRRPEFFEFIVHRCIASADGFELVEEVEHDLAQRHVVGQHHLTAVVSHIDLHAALLIGKRHHRADIFLRHIEMHGDDGFADFLHLALVRHLGGVFYQHHFAIRLDNLVDHARCRGDQVLVELTLQTLLHDFHMQ